MTQSLGNMVACEALRQGLHVGKYFMFDAAVPTEAIDATLDARGRIGWPGRFTDALVNANEVYNYIFVWR